MWMKKIELAATNFCELEKTNLSHQRTCKKPFLYFYFYNLLTYHVFLNLKKIPMKI